MEDLRAYEAEVHATCGQHDSVVGTVDRIMDPSTCPDCADIERMFRIQAERDKAADAKLGDNPPASAKLAADGRRWLFRLKAADEAATSKTGSGSSTGRGRRRQ